MSLSQTTEEQRSGTRERCSKAAAMCAIGVVLLSSCAHGHKLNLFAYTDGEQIYVEAYFPSGDKVQGADVFVYNADEKLLHQLKTDQNGSCSFKPGAIVPMKVVAQLANGRRGEYMLREGDLAAFCPKSLSVSSVSERASSPSSDEEASLRAELAHLRNELQALQRQVAAVRKHSPAPTARDVLIGVGFILGLTAFGAVMMRRKGASNRPAR